MVDALPTSSSITFVKSSATVSNTAIIGMSAGSGIAVAMWLCHPTWPPPESVVAVVVGAIMPVLHLIGLGIYNRVEKWSNPMSVSLPLTQEKPNATV